MTFRTLRSVRDPSRAGSQIATELQNAHPERIYLPLNL
jgi:hypothetical protein